MYIPEILAWSWTGHGALTTAAVSMAISQFVTLGKSFLEKRFVEIYKAWLGPPGKPSAQDCLTELMANLPEIVQNEDIHLANYIPGILLDVTNSQCGVYYYLGLGVFIPGGKISLPGSIANAEIS